MSIEWGTCPTCAKDVRVKVLLQHETSWEDDNAPVSGSDRFWILECGGCGKVFFGHGYTFSEEVDHRYNFQTGEYETFCPESLTFYPRTSTRQKPDWFNAIDMIPHPELVEILNEVYSAIDNDLPKLACMGIRSAFERLAIVLGQDKDASLKEKIEGLRKDQHITGRDRDNLETLVTAGNHAIHNNWTPEFSDLKTMLAILETTIHSSLLLSEKGRALQQRVVTSN